MNFFEESDTVIPDNSVKLVEVIVLEVVGTMISMKIGLRPFDELNFPIINGNDVMDDDQYTSANEEDEESTDETSDKKSDLNKNKINNSKETTGAKPKQKKKTVEEYEKELKAYEKTEQFEKCLEIKKKIDKLLTSKKKK
jgi:hypothetical protein